MLANTWLGLQKLVILGGVKEMVLGQDNSLLKSCFRPSFLGKDKDGENETKECIVVGIC